MTIIQNIVQYNIIIITAKYTKQVKKVWIVLKEIMEV